MEANDFSHFLQDEVFHKDENWSDFEGEHVRVCSSRDEFPSQGNRVQPAGQLVEEIRMTWK